ncbi:hypothetical protein CDAR_13781 [Caerostris darwini]|uniref:Maturase K n=1 Tax=Caerostris darwini TaxID=1538125 RepID=A0AAV4U7S9_9ARAC|nr:hypothetical protein CDAR_13781 [Caerostris darwini]
MLAKLWIHKTFEEKIGILASWYGMKGKLLETAVPNSSQNVESSPPSQLDENFLNLYRPFAGNVSEFLLVYGHTKLTRCSPSDSMLPVVGYL